jgi:hypothetical protein
MAANRRISDARSGAYAHIRKLHGLTGELTVWPAIADFDTGLEPPKITFFAHTVMFRRFPTLLQTVA